MAQFKGTVFIATRMFAEQTFGPDAHRRCLERLDAHDVAALSSVSAVGWYATEPVLRYHYALEELYGKSGDKFGVCEQAGRFSAKWGLNTITRAFLRFTTPHWVMNKYATVWERYHDSGRWEVVASDGPNSMSGRLFEFRVRDPAFCARLRGWLHGAIAMTGGNKVSVVESSCRCRGAPYCQFDCGWS